MMTTDNFLKLNEKQTDLLNKIVNEIVENLCDKLMQHPDIFEDNTVSSIHINILAFAFKHSLDIILQIPECTYTRIQLVATFTDLFLEEPKNE